jgi:hypothetical protein
VVWSPTAVAPLAVMQLIDGIDRVRWIALGGVLAFVMLLVGFLEDRLCWHRYTTRAGLAPAVPPSFPGAAFLGFAGICLAFGGLTAAIMALTGQRVPASLMAAAPLLYIGWVAVQQHARLRGRLPPDAPDSGAGAAQGPLPGVAPDTVIGATLAQLGRVIHGSLPLSAPAAVTLACSGYLGSAAAELVPAAALADWVGLDAMPGWVFLLAIAAGVAALAQLALTPIMMAVFFGSLLGALPSLPASPTLTALAISAGWALSMTCSPFASAVLLLTRMTGHSGTRLTWHWNGAFSAFALMTLAVAFWLLTAGR